MVSRMRVKIDQSGDFEFDDGLTAAQVIDRVEPGAKGLVLAVEINKKVMDLSTIVPDNAVLKFLKFEDDAGLDVFRHSSAHLMAQAVKDLFPDAKPTIGPVVEEGFYYDFYVETPFSVQDLKQIEKQMQKYSKKALPIERIELTREQALEMFADNPFKVEMIQAMEGQITAYRQGDFVDLCRGPHVPNTRFIHAVKLLKVAGAYWRGDAKNVQLQRIYGISFPTKDALKSHLKALEQAKERDHRRIGRQMDLFSFHDEGRGFPFWHAHGMVLRRQIEAYMHEVLDHYGYTEVLTPMILNQELWKRSGHYDHYRENMYFTEIDEVTHAVKPMNCPGGLLIYKARRHSYRELPLRVSEMGLVHRHEMSGVLHGLFRARAFTQDDAHIFCTPDQLMQEVVGVIRLIREVYATFGFNDVAVELSTRPDNSIGSDEMWKNAESALHAALSEVGGKYKVNDGDGAFYGPKIDFHVLDCMNRSWQCGTVQVDFSMPERFGAFYEDRDGTRKVPVMVHRAVLGSLERFIGILIEHYGGKFPLWLSPTQVKVLPVTDKVMDYAAKVADTLKNNGIRVVLDDRSETLRKKIREAQLERVNYQVVVGPREEEGNTVAPRTRGNEQTGPFGLMEFVDNLKKEIAERLIVDW